MNRLIALALCGSLLPFLAGWDLLRSPDADVERGTELFEAGDYGAAVNAYRRAVHRRGDEPAIHFNLGTALHEEALRKIGADRERLLAEAERSLRIATDTTDTALRATAFYNLGNTLYQQGRHGDAIEAYRRVLRVRPGDRDARHNLELALRVQRSEALRRAQAGESSTAADAAIETPSGELPTGGQQTAVQVPISPGDGSDAGEQPPTPPTEQPKTAADSPPPTDDQPGEDKPDQSPAREDEPRGDDDGDPRLPPPATFLSRSDRDRKLDQLERRSRNLRLKQLRRMADDGVRQTNEKDW